MSANKFFVPTQTHVLPQARPSSVLYKDKDTWTCTLRLYSQYHGCLHVSAPPFCVRRIAPTSRGRPLLPTALGCFRRLSRGLSLDARRQHEKAFPFAQSERARVGGLCEGYPRARVGWVVSYTLT